MDAHDALALALSAATLWVVMRRGSREALARALRAR